MGWQENCPPGAYICNVPWKNSGYGCVHHKSDTNAEKKRHKQKKLDRTMTWKEMGKNKVSYESQKFIVQNI